MDVLVSLLSGLLPFLLVLVALLSAAIDVDDVSGREMTLKLDPLRRGDLAVQELLALVGNDLGDMRLVLALDECRGKPEFSAFALLGDEARSWTFGIYGTWNVFAGLGNVGELKKARARKRAAEIEGEEVEPAPRIAG
mgnify:CR=1 FL=1